MTIKTSTGSSKTELSSRGKRPFKVFGFSRFFLPQTVVEGSSDFGDFWTEWILVDQNFFATDGSRG